MFTHKTFPFILLALALLLAPPACSQKKTAAEENAAKVKAFQEAQKAKAAQKYQRLIDVYGDSPYAAQAKERLQKLGPIATPKATPKKK
jgi:outer membrane protein assembly factor BamD (BamD/ComL family)